LAILVGYGQTTVTTKNFAGGATLDITVHKFHTDEQKAGQEYEVQYQDAAGVIQSQTNTEYTVLSNDLPAKTYFPYVSAVENKVRQGGALTFVNRTEYEYDPNTGNLTSQKDYDAPGPTSLFNDEFAAQNFNAWSSAATNGGTLSVTSAAKLTGNWGMQALIDHTLFVESGGTVVMEAEKYASLTAGTGNAAGSSWQSTTSIAGYQGSSAMQALPNSGVGTGLLTNGSALNYKINFQTIGTYYVYVRGYGPLPAGNSDSVHIGLDGTPVTTSAGIGLTGFNDSGFTWRGKYNGIATTINVTTAGMHTLNVWMREDGVAVDRIWLSTTAQSIEGSSSAGPAETATNGGVTQYVQSDHPAAATQYKAQFMFDPNTITATGNTMVLFSARDSDASGTGIVEVLFKYTAGTGYRIRTRIRDDAGNWVDGTYQTISDQAHTVGVYWAAATNAGANDGYVKLSIDGFVKDQLTGVDNDTRRVESARLGVVTASPTGTAGTLYFDNYQSWGTIATPYRLAEYDYATNTTPSVWILDKVKRQTLQDGAGAILSETRYGYDGTANGLGAKGELTLMQAVSGTQAINTAYVYDTYGNVTKTCVYTAYGTAGSLPSAACSGTSSSFRASTVTYDTTLKTYAESAANPLGQAVSTAYDFNLGLPTSVTDINGNITTTTYDGLGRAKTVTYPGYAQANVKYTYPAPPITAPFKVQLEAWDETAGVYRSAWTFYDGLGRPLRTQAPAETAGQLILTDAKYDARSLTQYTGLPRFLTAGGGTYYAPNWAAVPHSTFAYDALGRLTTTTFADNTTATTIYDGLKTTFRDQNAHQKVQIVDKFGRLVTVEEYSGTAPSGGSNTNLTLITPPTAYEYDVRDLLTKVTDTAGNQTTITYNNYSRKTNMTDPDMGAWTYGYDVFGNLTSQTDARGCVTTLSYDSLNRLTGKTYSGAGCGTTPAITYTYDSTTGGNEGVGKRTGMTDGSGSATWVYNVLGQMTKETKVITGSGTFVTEWSYDWGVRCQRIRGADYADCAVSVQSVPRNPLTARL
jgi:YD repeat-containing protein